jgi:hypothetical protein
VHRFSVLVRKLYVRIRVAHVGTLQRLLCVLSGDRRGPTCCATGIGMSRVCYWPCKAVIVGSFLPFSVPALLIIAAVGL